MTTLPHALALGVLLFGTLGGCGGSKTPVPNSPAATGTQGTAGGTSSFAALQDEMIVLERRACATKDMTAVLLVKDELDALSQRADTSSLTKQEEAALAAGYDRSMQCMAPLILEATKPKPGDPAYDKAARVVEMQLAIAENVANVFAAHAGHCNALVSELTKVLESIKPTIQELNTLASQDPDSMAMAEAMLRDELFAGRAASASATIEAGLQACPDALERSTAAMSPTSTP